ncbi:carboxymuconolactone decarboxylase family protein [Flectobacillus roseus]|uniref:Carboxymuconolactone decarboxylase family protein n=1 Tax=Flectobacillus roseus TaxID=502259 RepID=A0ABT6YG07_9BACT|nr:carboxymuconolactone decarboxylase family protein [Flectobacillus roseus]MDI9862514.1 carboxymuconolactone decarboxylase family protein [Flectobacillus roseus]
MKTFEVPTREQVSETNQHIFDNLKKGIGMVPNLYATFAHSDNALSSYVTLQSMKSALSNKEKEVVNLVVSQTNDCIYCLSAHTAIGKMNGFSDEQIIKIRKVAIDFDAKLQALAQFVKETTIERGHPSQASVEAFLEAGYTKAQLVDTIVLIGDKIITNYLHGVTQVPVDFPVAVAI